ncbi:MAG: rhodanese-like domain-containing protein [Verrucomicrobiota bacterium]
MTVDELKQWRDEQKEFRLVDVREQEEWDFCRIEGAVWIPLSAWQDRWQQALTDPQEQVVVYCHHGMRSASAVQFLQRVGFEQLHNLEGGIDAWSRTIDPGVPTY